MAPASPFRRSVTGRVSIVAHRGLSAEEPENTMRAFRRALEVGCDLIEFDVHRTRDGTPVVIHDDTVDRTTDGSGVVREMTLDRIRALDAGGGERIPTLAEVLELTTGRVLLVTEIKRPGIEERVAAVVRESDALADVMFWSFFPQALESMRRVEPRLPGGLLIGPETLPRWPEMRELAIRLGLQAVSVFCFGISEEIARDCRRSGLALYAWTADAEAEVARLIALGLDGICTNYPDRALALLESHARS